jgi:two-component system, OmpR family, sensor histidine kinase KdpD
VDDVMVEPERRMATSPVRLGVRPMGSLGLLGTLPSPQTIRAIVYLMSLTIEKARALEEASHAEAARQGEVLKSALLDSLAHDIKTPLTSIKAAVTSLLAQPVEGDRELLTIINEEADRLNQLAAEVIAMARVEAGKIHLEKQAVAVSELIASAVAEDAAAVKDRPVRMNVPLELPEAEADAEFVQQVIKQLIENAAKYSPPGSPIVISAERKGAKIVIGIADQGPGIEEEERGRIFDKFFRGREHRFATQGTGMGLAIAKGIVEAHGERIWVESEPGQGSAFYFSLPVRGGRTN